MDFVSSFKKLCRLVKVILVASNFVISILFWVFTFFGEYFNLVLVAPAYVLSTYWTYKRYREKEKFWEQFKQ
jgi:hypothetical protein